MNKKKIIAGLMMVLGFAVFMYALSLGLDRLVVWLNKPPIPPSPTPSGIKWGQITDVPPFTGNDNKKFPLLWSKRWAVEKNQQGICTQNPTMPIHPGAIVFVKFVDNTSGTLYVGTLSDRRKMTNSEKWYAARFSNPGSGQRGDIKISKKELFAVCNWDKNVVVHLEARDLKGSTGSYDTRTDLSATYGKVGNTIFNKKKRIVFTKPSEFFKDAGVKDFNHHFDEVKYLPPRMKFVDGRYLTEDDYRRAEGK